MNGHHPSLSEPLSTCSVGSQGRLFSFKLCRSGIGSCQSRRPLSLSRRSYLIGRIPGEGCAAKCARIRFCREGEVFALPGDTKTDTRTSKHRYKTTPRCLYLRACLPSSSSLIILLYFVRLVVSRATHHGVCRLQKCGRDSFLR